MENALLQAHDSSLLLCSTGRVRPKSAHRCIIFVCHSNSSISLFDRSGFLCVVIGRAKKCLDFTATVYFVHFVNCTVYSGFPSGVAWWALTTCSIVVMAMLGWVYQYFPRAFTACITPGANLFSVFRLFHRECLCFQRELREIPLSRVHQNL